MLDFSRYRLQDGGPQREIWYQNGGAYLKITTRDNQMQICTHLPQTMVGGYEFEFLGYLN